MRTRELSVGYAGMLLSVAISAAWPRVDALAQSPGRANGAHDIVVNGVRLWYRVAGKSTAGVAPVVFLHGGPGYNSASFSTMAGPALERGLRMVYFDQRGAGRSERPWNDAYSLDLLVDDVEGLRRALGVPRISLIGHSFGGLLALEYAAKYPARVARVVLVSAASDLPAACHARVEWLAAHRTADLERARADTTGTGGRPKTDCDLAFQALPDQNAFDAYNRSVMFPDSTVGLALDRVDSASGLRNTGEQQRALMAHGLLTYRFSSPEKLTMPVLVLAGRHDSAIGLDQQEKLAHALPNGHLEIYDRAGHFLYLDDPDRFTRDVTGFLSASPHG